MVKITRHILYLFMALCLVAGIADARDTDQTWPIGVKLFRNYDDAVHTWDDVGDVSIWNDRNNVTIYVDPYDGYMISKVGIHLVNDPVLFEDVLDNKGKPKMKNFTYVKDYVADFGGPVSDHTGTIDMDLLEMCWSVKPEICPTPTGTSLLPSSWRESKRPPMPPTEESSTGTRWSTTPG